MFLIGKNAYIERGLDIMWISHLLKGGICEVSFGYYSEMEGYATLMSDIPKVMHNREQKV